jgi:hypothetical protein
MDRGDQFYVRAFGRNQASATVKIFNLPYNIF